MYLESISIHNFRNISKADIPFSNQSRYIIISGDNAQGKTNLLEAVSCLLTSQSFLESNAENLVQFDKDYFFIKGRMNKNNSLYDTVFSYDKGIKRVLVNKKAITTLSRFREYFPCIAFSANQTEEFLRGPVYRRKLLDRLIMQVSTEYTTLLKDYYKTLKNRNIMLKLHNTEIALFSQYTDTLISLCTKITEERLIYLKNLEDISSLQLFDKFRVFLPRLKPVILQNSREIGQKTHVFQLFDSLAKKNYELDMKTGFTSWGLSRSDFVFYLDKRTILKYSSRGQVKLIMIMLLLIQSEIIRNIVSVSPILLIDDMFGEMGDIFIESLFDVFDRFRQVFITDISGISGLCRNDNESEMIIMKDGNPIRGVDLDANL